MQKVEIMLRGGATPEWICNRPPWFDLPLEIQTALINALHWRQAEFLNETPSHKS